MLDTSNGNNQLYVQANTVNTNLHPHSKANNVPQIVITQKNNIPQTKMSPSFLQPTHSSIP